MSTPENCSVANCGRPAGNSLDSEPLCRAHFISTCYQRLDEYDDTRNGPGLTASDSEAARRFIHESTRQADAMESTAQDLDNLDRAKLLHIIISASELGRHLRRSPRKVAVIAVRLSSEKIGGAWEEETETLLVSRFGALVWCNHAAKAGETIQISRADTGATALARIAWQRPTGSEGTRVGVEFLSCENFWGLDWGVVEELR